MLKHVSLQVVGPALTILLVSLGRADAAGAPIDRWPGSVCQPVDAESYSRIVYTSAAAIANFSQEEPAWVQCPVRTPDTLSAGQIVEWSGTFLTPMNTPCTLRLISAEGETLGSATGTPWGQNISGLGLSVVVGDFGVQKVTASVHCKLPGVSHWERPAGIVTFSSRTKG